MEKIIVEVGSTNTKIDIYDGKEVRRLDEVTIFFKQNYKKDNKINSDDLDLLIKKILELKEKYSDIYVCGTSIFRDLSDSEREEFLSLFKDRTGYDFNIISQEMENELTVLGATRFVKDKVCVFVGGGGSTEISIYDGDIIESKNSSIGGMDVMAKFPDLANDTASTSLEEVVAFIEKSLVIPAEKADIMILAGGGHEVFARGSGIMFEDNTLYDDESASIMMDIDSRRRETKRYYEEISLDNIRKNSNNPDWWYATRAMCAFVLAVANKIGAKYIVPTNISMVYGIVEQNKNNPILTKNK